MKKAIANANRSIDEKVTSRRDYTYSELGKLIEKLERLSLFILDETCIFTSLCPIFFAKNVKYNLQIHFKSIKDINIY